MISNHDKLTTIQVLVESLYHRLETRLLFQFANSYVQLQKVPEKQKLRDILAHLGKCEILLPRYHKLTHHAPASFNGKLRS